MAQRRCPGDCWGHANRAERTHLFSDMGLKKFWGLPFGNTLFGFRCMDTSQLRDMGSCTPQHCC